MPRPLSRRRASSGTRSKLFPTELIALEDTYERFWLPVSEGLQQHQDRGTEDEDVARWRAAVQGQQAASNASGQQGKAAPSDTTPQVTPAGQTEATDPAGAGAAAAAAKAKVDKRKAAEQEEKEKKKAADAAKRKEASARAGASGSS